MPHGITCTNSYPKVCLLRRDTAPNLPIIEHFCAKETAENLSPFANTDFSIEYKSLIIESLFSLNDFSFASAIISPRSNHKGQVIFNLIVTVEGDD